MAKVLKLNFVNADKKRSTIVIKNPKEGLQEVAVRAAMDKIVAAKVFTKDGLAKYAGVAGANYYTTNSEDVFKDATK